MLQSALPVRAAVPTQPRRAVATRFQKPGREDLFAGAHSQGALPLKFGFPKGSLQKSTQELFNRAGFEVKISERGYFPKINDDELAAVLLRSQEVPRYVEDGVLDCGICGHDWVVESNSDVVEVCELKYSKATSAPARWVLAVPENSSVLQPKDLAGDAIIASELVGTTERFFRERNIPIRKVEYSWGATEVKARLPGVAAIVDITETGASLSANKLRIIATILESTTRLVANRQSWEDPVKRAKIEDLASLLQGAVEGRSKVGVKMNLERSRLDDVVALLPSELSPTVSPLLSDRHVAVEVVVDEEVARQLVTKCKRLGATGIVTYDVGIMLH
ncbi:unnamed protein product [Pedinophyceae sp. YPF-701]|nr:unnamed protein product [Pedinophyceae sp. YPF-701]